MVQSPLVTVNVPALTQAPIGEQLEHSTMDLKKAGSLPSQNMDRCNSAISIHFIKAASDLCVTFYIYWDSDKQGFMGLISLLKDSIVLLIQIHI